MGITKIANLRMIKEQHKVMLIMMGMLKDMICHVQREIPFEGGHNHEKRFTELARRIEKLLDKEEELIKEALNNMNKGATDRPVIQQNGPR